VSDSNDNRKQGGHVLPLAIIGIVVGVCCVLVATLIDWLPEAAAKEADPVDTLIWWTVWVSIGVFTVVVTFLIYSIWRFRAPPGDERDGDDIHGHTMLEVIWTAIPAVIIGATGIWAAMVVIDNEKIAKADGANGGPVEIEVLAQQFSWEFTYEDAGITTGVMKVPAGRQVVLTLRSKDVIHDFFVYETRIKGDAVPGITNNLVRFTMKPETAGKSYPIVCAELCGAGHAVMRARLDVLSPADYDKWLADARQSVQG